MVADARAGRASAWLDHLPAIYREGAQPDFLGRFLLAFEHLLTGLGDAEEPGLDELIDRVHEYFDPQRTPAGFLEWLAGWVAVSLRGDLDSLAGSGEETDEARAARERRAMARATIAHAVPLYRLRGTRRGLEELIRLFTGGLSPTITEPAGEPHFFHVLLRLPHPDPAMRGRVEALVRAVVDVEKPAHTLYRLDVVTPALQIGVHSQIGVDTLLVPFVSGPPDDGGEAPAPPEEDETPPPQEDEGGIPVPGTEGGVPPAEKA